MTKSRFFLFGKSCEGLHGAKQTAFVLWNTLWLFVSAFAAAVCSLYFAYGSYSESIFYDYFGNTLLLLLNFLPILLFQLLMYCVFGRQWLAFLLTALVFLVASAGSYFKLQFRGDPFMASDISAVYTALGVAGGYDIVVDGRVLAAILCTLGLTVLLAFFARGRIKARLRIIGFVLIAGSVLPLWKYVYSSDTLYKSEELSSDRVNEWIATQVYVSRGFVYPFIHSFGDVLDLRPEGYSDKKAKAALADYTDAEIAENKRVNIIAIQLEAYADLTRLGWGDIADEVYAEMHALEEESFTGDLVVNIFAGGTVDTERCFLTGYSQLFEYRSRTESYVSYLASQGYYTVGSHPCYEDFYNRVNVNENLGFEEYYFLENHYSELTDGEIGMDRVLLPEILRLYREALRAGKSVFSYNVTYQGHGPYDSDQIYYADKYFSGDISLYGYNILNNYFGGIKDTNDNIRALVEELRTDPEPVVLVLYGDHMPWLGNNSSVYAELGLNYVETDLMGLHDYYTTRYLIWANDAAKELTGCDFSGEGEAISPCFLMNVLFDKLGYDGSAYMQYTDTVMSTVPVMNATCGFFFENGELTAELSEEASALYRQFKAVEYYSAIRERK